MSWGLLISALLKSIIYIMIGIVSKTGYSNKSPPYSKMDQNQNGSVYNAQSTTLLADTQVNPKDSHLLLNDLH